MLLDLASRRVVAWAVGTTLETTLPLTALQRALAWRQPAPGLIQHTDRGSQYASQAYRAVLRSHGIVQSMSRQGDCWENAVAESFFATLEHELLATADFHSHREAERAIADFIDDWYNPTRRHSALGYVSPLQYERQLGQMARAAQTLCPFFGVKSNLHIPHTVYYAAASPPISASPGVDRF